MKKIKIPAILLMVALLVLSLTGCVTFDNFKAAFIDKPQDKETIIQIGVLEPVTGSDSKAAEAEIRGIQLANTVHPNVDGKMIELVFSDNKSDIDAAKTAAETLIVKEPAVILGSYGSVYSLAAGPSIEAAKIPAIAITNSNPLVTKNNDFYFRVCYVDSNQGDLLAQYVLNELKEETAGVLMPSGDDAALAMATAFTDRIKSQTGNEDAIIAYEEYQAGGKDFTEELKAIADTGVKNVILPGDVADCENIINQAADMDLHITFLGGTEWNDEAFKTSLGTNVETASLAFVSFFSNDDDAIDDSDAVGEAVSEEREKFLKAYHEQYGNDSDPEDAVALGYDAYLVAIDAIDKADDATDGEKIAQILLDPKYSFNGASGYINFDGAGDPIKTAYIVTWKDDKTTTLFTIEPTR